MYHFSAQEIRKRFLEGALSAEEIAHYFLARIDKYDPKIGAFLQVYHRRMLEQAQKLDQKRKLGKPLGKLAGVPIALKDNIHVQGEITTCASRFLKEYRAPFSATVTERIEAEDGLIIGKTNLDEFAMGSSTENSALQMTNNPWALDCVPGGSSGGSAAACSARLVPLALGSDTGGSVRQPAAFCGVLGMKPTYGRVSRFGLVAFASSLDQIGPFATSTEDLAMLMEVIGQHDERDATSLPLRPEEYLSQIKQEMGSKVIGVPWAFLEGLTEEPKKHFMNALEVLKQMGCKIVEVDLNSLHYSVATYYIIATAEASTNLARFDGIRYGARSKEAKNLEELYELSRTEGFGKEVKKRIMLGTYVLSAGYQDAYYKQATKVRVKIIDEFEKAFMGCDLIVTPVSPTEAFAKNAIQDPLSMYLQDIYTIGVNLAGLSALSIPCGFSKEKKPFGMQIIGPKKKDLLVCNLAHAYEKAAPFTQQIPPEFDKE